MTSPAEQSLIDTIVTNLGAALRRRYGEQVSVGNVEVATFGASNRTVLFDLVEGAGRQRLVLRQETLKSEVSPFISTHDQYRILEVVHRHGLPVPAPVFELTPDDALDNGFIVTCVDGETLPKKLLGDPLFADAGKKFAGQCGEILARLHAIDPAEVGFLESTVDSVDPLAAQVMRYEAYNECHPGLDVGIRWLENHRPAATTRKFIHGEFRNGNLLLGSDGIRAVLDWECAHIGAAMEEFGWLCMRSWRYGNIDKPVGGFGQRAELYAAYQANGGEPVDEDAVRWWEIFAALRWAVINMMQVDGHISGGRRSLPFACCGRNTSMIEYDMLMMINGSYH